MSYEVRLGTRAVRQVGKLDPQIRKTVESRMRKNLALNPYEYPLLSGKYSQLRKLAFSTAGGEFRVIYTVRESKKRVVILFLGSRENFYKELQRYLG